MVGFAIVLVPVYLMFTGLMQTPSSDDELGHALYPQAAITSGVHRSRVDYYAALAVATIILWLALPLGVISLFAFSSTTTSWSTSIS